MKAVALGALVLFCLAACSQKPSSPVAVGSAPSIIGGIESDDSEIFLRQTVAIGDEKRAWCSGSIYSDSIVITAAHCVAMWTGEEWRPSPSKLKIYFGKNVRSTDRALIRDVDSYRISKGYQTDSMDMQRFIVGNDFAVVKFKGGLPLGYGAVTLLDSSTDLVPGATIAMAGYGCTDHKDSNGTFGLLHYFKTEFSPYALTENDEWMRPYLSSETPGTFHIIKPTDKDTCSGDSGGPQFVLHRGEWKQWGITKGYSHKASDAENGFLSYYADVLSKRDFILESAGSMHAEAERLDALGEAVTSFADFPLARTLVQIANEKTPFVCTGVIISEGKVITSHKCFPRKERYAKRTKIRFIDPSSGEVTERLIESYKKNEKYRDPTDTETDFSANDFVTLKFAGGLPSGFAPANPGYLGVLWAGSEVVTFGYGLSIEDFNEGRSTLRTARTIVLNESIMPTLIQTDRWLGKDNYTGYGNPIFFYDDGEWHLVGISTAHKVHEGSFFLDLTTNFDIWGED